MHNFMSVQRIPRNHNSAYNFFVVWFALHLCAHTCTERYTYAYCSLPDYTLLQRTYKYIQVLRLVKV